MNLRSTHAVEAEVSALASAVPSGFLKLSADRLQQSIARQLGYFGRDRFVMFWYDPRGGEVVWADGRSSGFGTGGWQAFFDEVEPVARRHGMDVGGGMARGPHALVVDMDFGHAYFADRRAAQALVSGQPRRAMSA